MNFRKLSFLIICGIFLMSGCKTSQKNNSDASASEISKKNSQDNKSPKKSGIFSVVTETVTNTVSSAVGVAGDLAVGAGNLAVGAGSLAVDAVGTAASAATDIAGAAVDVTKVALHEAAKFIGLAKDAKTGWHGTITRMPFNHHSFGDGVNSDVLKTYNPPEALILANAIDFEKFQMLFNSSLSTSYSNLEPDFSKNIFIAVADRKNPDVQHVQISRVDEGESFMIQVTAMVPSFGCGTLFAHKNKKPMHLIKLNKADLLEGELSSRKSVKVIYSRQIEYCPRAFVDSNSVNFNHSELDSGLQKVDYKSHFRLNHRKNKSDVLVAAVPMADKWGQWDLFKEDFCGDCDGLELPAGYPKTTHLLALIDQSDLSNDGVGHRMFSVNGLYRYKGSLVVDAHRTVSLCNVKSTNTIEILEIDKKDINQISDFLRKEQVLFTGPLVPEDQIPCSDLSH